MTRYEIARGKIAPLEEVPFMADPADKGATPLYKVDVDFSNCDTTTGSLYTVNSSYRFNWFGDQPIVQEYIPHRISVI